MLFVKVVHSGPQDRFFLVLQSQFFRCHLPLYMDQKKAFEGLFNLSRAIRFRKRERLKFTVIVKSQVLNEPRS